MTSYKEGKHAAEFILWEEGGTLSRDNVPVNAEQKFGVGTIVKGGVAVSGTPVSPGLAIAIYAVDTTAATGTGVAGKVAAISRNAEVNRHCLGWPAGYSDAQKDALAVQLANQMIIVRGSALPSPIETRSSSYGAQFEAPGHEDDLQQPRDDDDSPAAQRQREEIEDRRRALEARRQGQATQLPAEPKHQGPDTHKPGDAPRKS
jgi:hypothetical protein